MDEYDVNVKSRQLLNFGTESGANLLFNVGHSKNMTAAQINAKLSLV